MSAADIVRRQAPGFAPRLALLLGSGLRAVAETLRPFVTIPYADLPGLPVPTVRGHGGRLTLGTIEDLPSLCFEGRAHLYEGDAKGPLGPVRLAKDLGVAAFLATSAVGGIRDDLRPGALVRIADHLNLTGANPLIGPNDESYGPRFPDLGRAYDPGLGAALDRAAAGAGVDLASGVYAGWLGPSFETPAEIRMMRTLGADVVGMSTVAEAIAAAHCGLRFAAVSVVVNRAAGLVGATLSHDETLARAAEAGPGLAALVRAFAQEMGNEEIGNVETRDGKA